MSKLLKIQELENNQQTVVIKQKSVIISRFEEALISMDRKCKPEVLETGKNTFWQWFLKLKIFQCKSLDNFSLFFYRINPKHDDRRTRFTARNAGSGIEEDVTGLEVDLTELDENVDFLFDEQIIQDERLLELEQTSDEVVVELAEINANLLGKRTRNHYSWHDFIL